MVQLTQLKMLSSSKALRPSPMTIIVIIFGFMASIAVAEEATAIRPIEDFVNNQGTLCIDNGQGGCLFPPTDNFITWTAPSQEREIAVDYAGLWSKRLSLGTTTDGKITERPLADGRAEVTVLLHTKKALTWATKFDPNIAFDPTNLSTYQFLFQPVLLGHRPSDVLEGQDAALGDSFLKVVFINTAPGAPMPDLAQLAFFPESGQELLSVTFSAQADGRLREAFGVPDGTPGRAEVAQTGLIFVAGKANPSSRVALDGFPAEYINLNAVGR